MFKPLIEAIKSILDAHKKGGSIPPEMWVELERQFNLFFVEPEDDEEWKEYQQK